MIDVEDRGRVRVLTINRPEALNAFDEDHYNLIAKELRAAGDDPGIAVAVLTGTGRSFCAGTDVKQMSARNDGDVEIGAAGFVGFLAALLDFPKPLLIAVNGLAIGIGATMLGLADLVLVSASARLRYPFTELGVAPEAASSYLLPRQIGRQAGAWALLSSEWLSATEALEMGIAWKVCPPDDLMAETLRYADVLAEQPIESLVTTKRLIVAPYRDAAHQAMQRENQAFAELLGGPANRAALQRLAERRAKA